MILEQLPTRIDGAAANMAADFLLLRRHPEPTRARFRAYGWTRPAVTFGYSQKIAWVRERLPEICGEAADEVELCRRPTGGGVVDHREDWTYALVIPRGHVWEEWRAVESYRAVHAALREALVAQGVEAVLKATCEADADGCGGEGGPTVCFRRPELYDLLHAGTGRKLAGAAQKRTKHGLLVQGSVDRRACGVGWDDEELARVFARTLAVGMELEWAEAGWPDWPEGEWEALTDHYGSDEWRELR